MPIITQQSRASTPTYVGFTTYQRTQPPYTVTDIECVKQDLLNVFQTRIGERVMLPEFGSRIHDLLFEPFDDFTRDEVLEDIDRVLTFEPRATLESSNVVETDYGLQIELRLIYTPGDTAETLFIDFVRDSEDAV
jgi:phage baseplate assembly protein W